MPRLSVIIPSRLAINPMSEARRLYLDRAIFSVRQQTVGADAEIIVGLSPDTPVPVLMSGCRGAYADRPGQNAAVNAAVAASAGDVLAFLEDDDHWNDKRLEYGLAALEQGYDFVSSNQREVTVDGSYVRVNDFPTPSSWLMPRATWDAVGPMDETFKWHLDTEWLGRLNTATPIRATMIDAYRATAKPSHFKRIHFVEKGAGANPRDWLSNVMRFSQAAETEEREPLVNRTVNPEGGMAKIARDPVANAESREEHARMAAKFGCYPW